MLQTVFRLAQDIRLQIAVRDVHTSCSASWAWFLEGLPLALATFHQRRLKQIRSRRHHLWEGVATHADRRGLANIYPAWWRDVPMNNRSHAGMKPVLSLCQSSVLMACRVLPCWPVMSLREYILRKGTLVDSVVPWFHWWMWEEGYFFFFALLPVILFRCFWERIQGGSNGWRGRLIAAPDKSDSVSQGKSQRVSGLTCSVVITLQRADSEWDSSVTSALQLIAASWRTLAGTLITLNDTVQEILLSDLNCSSDYLVSSSIRDQLQLLTVLSSFCAVCNLKSVRHHL